MTPLDADQARRIADHALTPDLGFRDEWGYTATDEEAAATRRIPDNLHRSDYSAIADQILANQ